LIGTSDFDEIFKKMQDISAAFWMAMFGFWELEYVLLGEAKKSSD
jgi:hypothetical protein